MKLWIDDVRPAPEGYDWLYSVNEAKQAILYYEEMLEHTKKLIEIYEDLSCDTSHFRHWLEEYQIEIIDIDHDAGDYACYGGDYIKLLDWLEETGRNYPIRIHSMNPVGVENMRSIIQRNGWTEAR